MVCDHINWTNGEGIGDDYVKGARGVRPFLVCVLCPYFGLNKTIYMYKEDFSLFPNLPPLKELVSIFYHLMGAADETDAVGFIELLNNVPAKGVRHSSIIFTPAQDVLNICILT